MGNTRSFMTATDHDPDSIKLHLGCGGIYLRDYINCDVHGDVRMPGDPEPEHATTADRYYAGLDGDQAHVPARRAAIVDRRLDMREVSEIQRADKILAVQCLEHLSFPDALQALNDWAYCLRGGGHAIISVPWAHGSLELLADSEPQAFAIRHLVGTRTREQYRHLSFYNHDTLAVMLRCAGFKSYTFLDNPHFYPALIVRAEA